MKTIREHFNTLPEPYRTQAIENTKYQNFENLNKTSPNVQESLLVAFYWDETKQGNEYWDDLCWNEEILGI